MKRNGSQTFKTEFLKQSKSIRLAIEPRAKEMATVYGIFKENFKERPDWVDQRSR